MTDEENMDEEEKEQFLLKDMQKFANFEMMDVEQ